ncbi:MAG: hypothetical protein U9O78_04360 [Patescibacteria group bacterium]|nr:hypothetical protein [Patescibacteria group bacterium]
MNNITKPEIRFWLAIIIVVVGGVIAFTSLRKDVEAMMNREQTNKEQFYNMVEDIESILDKVICIDKNQAIIMNKLGIEEQ